MIREKGVRALVSKLIGVFMIEIGGIFFTVTLGSSFLAGYSKAIEWIAAGCAILVFVITAAFSGRIANNLVASSYLEGSISAEDLTCLYGVSKKPNRVQAFTGPRIFKLAGKARSGITCVILSSLFVLMIFGDADDALVRSLAGVIVIAAGVVALMAIPKLEAYRFKGNRKGS